MTKDNKINEGYKDICRSIKNINLPIYLANSDIRQRYRRSTLGPFWITISTGVMIGCIGLIFGKLFKSPMEEFLPFLASGLIIWGFISSVLIDSTSSFSSSETIIKQLDVPLFSHIVRMLTRNVIIFFHNLIILPVVFLCLDKGINLNFLYIFPGFALLVINLLWISLVLGIICTRFRDLTQIVSSLLQVAFYVTPIIWMPKLLPARASVMLLDPNPFYHLIEVIRDPILGVAPSYLNWVVSGGLAVFGWLLAIIAFNKFRARIAYWL